MSASSDVAQAVAAQWDGKALDVSVPGGLYLDELPRGDAALPDLPYAAFSCERDRKPKWGMGSYTEFTRVKFTLYGVEVLGDALSAIRAAFAWPGNKLDFTQINANCFHKYTELGDEDEAVTNVERNGRRLREATLTLIVWTQRTGG